MRYEKISKQRRIEAIERNPPTAEAILTAAEELFTKNGYHSVTTREIAAKANVNLGLISYYFISKENLAKVVYHRIRNRYREHTEKQIPSQLGCAEQLYIWPILTWRALQKLPGAGGFCVEFLAESRGDTEVTDTFTPLSWEIIRTYHLNVSIRENDLYLTALIGAEQLMTVKWFRQELDVPYEKIIDVVISNYFYNIGLDDCVIAEIIGRGKTALKELNL